MPEFSKAERRTLRELAGRVYEADARLVLSELEREFSRWRANEIESSELLEKIHKFHQEQSRELWSRYQSLREPEIVARGLALGFINESEVPEGLRISLAPLVDFFGGHNR
jgi:hypothetical protein